MTKNAEGVLAFMLVEGVSPFDCYRLETAPEEWPELLRSAAGRELLGDMFGRRVTAPDWDVYEAQRVAMRRTGTAAISAWDAAYPETLRCVEKPPPLLFFKGDATLLARGGVAVVGTRKPTPAGVTLTRRIARDLSLAGVEVTSGMARGIDRAAHEGALSGNATTIAVLGTGLDVPYPPENADLMVEIGRRGCVVSEQLMGTPPSRHAFPQRNRMISGLSAAVIVVQGGAKSGALITARWALEQGRDVGAVPGFPGDFRSDGPNALLRTGAFMVESARDIFENVAALGRAPGGQEELFSSPRRIVGDRTAADIYAAIDANGIDADGLADMLEFDVTEIQQTLTRMEIEGLIRRDETGRYVRDS